MDKKKDLLKVKVKDQELKHVNVEDVARLLKKQLKKDFPQSSLKAKITENNKIKIKRKDLDKDLQMHS